MSWIGALKGKKSEPEVSPRTAKRNKLQAERLQRAQQRDRLKKQLKAVQEAKEAAEKKAEENGSEVTVITLYEYLLELILSSFHAYFSFSF